MKYKVGGGGGGGWCWGGSNLLLPQKKLPSKNPALLGLNCLEKYLTKAMSIIRQVCLCLYNEDI